jgi:hypothetical protein
MSSPNPYTCRLLRRLDLVIYRLRGIDAEFSKTTGHLVYCPPELRHSWELTSHFPDWMFRLATKIQNRWLWTRKVLSA